MCRRARNSQGWQSPDRFHMLHLRKLMSSLWSHNVWKPTISTPTSRDMGTQAASTPRRPLDGAVTSVKLTGLPGPERDGDDGNKTFNCDEEPHMLSPDLGYGYYPITLGDQLHNGKYEIVRKLGWAAYASVWLAKICE